MNSNRFQRVSKRRPCPICEKGDWCLFAGPEDAPTAAICSRTESDKRCGEAGWLHRLRRDDHWRPRQRSVRLKTPTAKAGATETHVQRIARIACSQVTDGRLEQFADSLGLSVASLRRLQTGWSATRSAWTFPMRDTDGRVTGIRLRFPDGQKLSVRGGKEGLFVPADLGDAQRILIAEGPTDSAALLDLGFTAIGRPSCTGGVKLLVDLIKQQQPREVVVIADRDAPGQRGAETLAAAILAYLPQVKIVVPPDGINDARGWKQAGATRADVEAVIDAAPVRRLSIGVQQQGSHDGQQ